MDRIHLPDADGVLERLPGLDVWVDLGTLAVARAQSNDQAVLGADLESVDALFDRLPADGRALTILGVARRETTTDAWHPYVPVALGSGVPHESVRAIGAREFDRRPERDRPLVRFVSRVS